MSTMTQEIVEICAALPEENVAEVVKFARALRQTAETSGDAAWERIIATAAPRPRLDEFMRLAFADGDDSTECFEARAHFAPTLCSAS